MKQIEPAPLLDTLKNRSEFQAVRSGKRRVTNNFILQATHLSKSTKSVRVGYTITKKIGNAVERNRIRRRLKHAVATAMQQANEKNRVQLGDMVLVAKRGALTTSYPSLVEELTKTIDQLATKGNKANRNR